MSEEERERESERDRFPIQGASHLFGGGGEEAATTVTIVCGGSGQGHSLEGGLGDSLFHQIQGATALHQQRLELENFESCP